MAGRMLRSRNMVCEESDVGSDTDLDLPSGQQENLSETQRETAESERAMAVNLAPGQASGHHCGWQRQDNNIKYNQCR
jgi:hypothetical protein